MNVTCEGCQRRYTVPDEKLREQPVVKLRCRNCQNVIEVALPPPPPAGPPVANPWDEEPTRAAPALDKRAQWFAMVKGQQLGPLELPALEAKVRRGEIGLATFLWRDGMAEWKKAAELPELLPVFAAPKSSAPAQPPPAPAPSAHLENLFDDEERTVLKPKPKVAKPAKAAAAPVRKAEDDVDLDVEDAEQAPEPARKGRRGTWIALAVLALAALGAVAAALVLR